MRNLRIAPEFRVRLQPRPGSARGDAVQVFTSAVFTSALVGIATWLAFLWVGARHADGLKSVCDRVEAFKPVGEFMGD